MKFSIRRYLAAAALIAGLSGCASMQAKVQPCLEAYCSPESPIDYADLQHRLNGKSLGASMPQEQADALMPWSYRFSNPNGRPYHNDHAAPFLPPEWQPWAKIRRMDNTYMLPMPMKLVWQRGGVTPRWMPWQENYPGGLAPDAQLRPAAPGSQAEQMGVPREILAFDPVLGPGQAAVYAAYIDGAWRACYYTRTDIVMGRRLHHNHGLKPDVTLSVLYGQPVGDFMWTWPEFSATWKVINR